MGLEAVIWLLRFLTEAWLWEKSVNIAIGLTVLFGKRRNWCNEYDSQGYDGIFYCL